MLASLILGPAIVLLVRYWYLTLAELWGALAAIGVLAAEAVVVVALLRWGAVWRQRKATEAA